ncbi:MAG: hypothetical protein JWN56_2658 [Sphingobacteriales bacterium]|nr:hypothetical protein [Sphingobacteriales bacterium]
MKLKVYKKYVSSLILAICCTQLALAQAQQNINQLASLNFDKPVFDKQASNAEPGADNWNIAEKSKKISKSYPVDRNDKLSVNNQYGKVEVHTWAKNEIKVDIEIKAFESSDEKAQRLLEDVRIEESKNTNLISFKTIIERNNMNWTSRFRNGKEERKGVQINYVVYMPTSNPLDITNRYGSTNLDDFSGPVIIDNAYGSFSARMLSNAANRVKIGYGSADINGTYSGNLDVAYGSLNLTIADKIDAGIRYSSAKIDKVINGGNFDIKYTGGFKISELDKSVKSLNVDASYSEVGIGVDALSNFDFEVSVNYAGFQYNDNKVTITSKTPEDSEKGFKPRRVYKGYFGKSSDAMVNVKSNYGNVKFQ